ncbi:MAG: hypothetical protein KIT72_05975 [Polyangiaceae bacterium]|nr:hypothetical protein [Polyangiaceae bacterium]MCW5789948.1 hypothetical protein [Polyangiaceae bacterium]
MSADETTPPSPDEAPGAERPDEPPREDAARRLSRPEAPQGLARHLQGWQLGVVLVGAALLAAAIGVPRAVPPETLPLPRLRTRDLAADLAAERARAEEAKRAPLSFEARAIGDAYRRYGLAEAVAPSVARERERTLKARVARLRQLRPDQADAELLQLRALQTELFIAALRESEGSEPQVLKGDEAIGSSPLLELGGRFAGPGHHPSWFAAGRFVGSDEEASVLLRARWNLLLGLSEQAPFSLSLAERLAALRFLMAHPEGADLRAQRVSQLGYVEAIAARQPEYPSAIAKGTIFYHMGNYGMAAAAFEDHLERPDGPFSLRARNHLIAAADRLRAQELGE